MREWWIHLYTLITDMTFWHNLLLQMKAAGPLFAIFLAALESVIPPLPLVAIVALNVKMYGVALGFLYSWIGTCIGCTLMFSLYRFIFRRLIRKFSLKHRLLQKAREWVDGVNAPALFFIAMMPFTPSFFLNFSFGVSEYETGKYLPVLYTAKLIMIGSLAILGQTVVQAAKNPVFIILAILIFLILYYLSKKVTKKHHLEVRG